MASYGTRRRTKIEVYSHPDRFCGSGNDQDGFEVVQTNSMLGFGVFATRRFEKGEFLLEYAGERISEVEAFKRESKYKKNKVGCFIYYNVVDIHGKFCIDATYSDQAGRLVNDSPHKFANAIMKRHVSDRKYVYVALFAIKDIELGTEIRYDYGDNPAEMPWRKKVKYLQPTHMDDYVNMEKDSTKEINDDFIDFHKDGMKEEAGHSMLSTPLDNSLPDSAVVLNTSMGEVVDSEDDNKRLCLKEEKCSSVSTAGSLPSSILPLNLLPDGSARLSTLCNNLLPEGSLTSLTPPQKVAADQCLNNYDSFINIEAGSLMDDSAVVLGTSIGEVVDSDDDGSDFCLKEEKYSFVLPARITVSSTPTKNSLSSRHFKSSTSPQKLLPDVALLSSTPEGSLQSLVPPQKLTVGQRLDIEEGNLMNDFAVILKIVGEVVDTVDANCSFVLPARFPVTSTPPKNSLSGRPSSTPPQNLLPGAPLPSSTLPQNLLQERLLPSLSPPQKLVVNHCLNNDNSFIDTEEKSLLNDSANNSLPGGSLSSPVPPKNSLSGRPFKFSTPPQNLLPGAPLPSFTLPKNLFQQRSLPLLSPPQKLAVDHCLDNDESFTNIEERSLLNDSAVVLGTSMGEVVDTDDDNPSLEEEEEEEKEKKVRSKKKIHRPCPFCKGEKLHSALTRHLRSKHKDEPAVKAAMSLPKREQIAALALLRKDGIFAYNMEEMKKKDPAYIRERRCSVDTDELVMCAACKGCYAKSYKPRHQLHCGRNSGQVMIPVVPMESLVRVVELDKDFKAVINKMIQDEVSTLVKNDPVILMIGARVYNGNKCKSEKKYEVEKRVRGTMRQLARLYMEFSKSKDSLTNDASDMFRKENLAHLRTSIDELCQGEDQMKCGLKVQLQNIIKLAAKMLHAHFLVNGKDGDADAVRDFIAVFGLVQDEIFGDALYQIRQKRNKSTRKPASLPNEQAVGILTEYLSKTTAKDYLTFEYPNSIFVDVRDSACARLTVYNGRRGGEPARLFLYQWTEAVEGTWLREETRNNYRNEINTGNRITFQEGKGNKQVPVFIPPDLVPAMEFLSSAEVRKDSDVAADNLYMFPSTKGSDNHVSGWHALVNCCRKAGLVDKVTGTMNRHRVSTLIGSLGLPESDQQLVFDHFGHSGDVNRNIYQVPQAERQLKTTGRYLHLIDQGLASGQLNKDVAMSNQTTLQKSNATISISKETVSKLTNLKESHTTIAIPKNTANSKTNTLKQGYATRTAKVMPSRDISTTTAVRKKRKVLMPISDDDDDFDTSTDEDDDVYSEQDCAKSSRTYFQWSESQKTKFVIAFQKYVDRDSGYPDRKELTKFAKENKLTYARVRTRIINERASRKTREKVLVKKNKAILGIK